MAKVRQIFCAKCDKLMKPTLLPYYEFEEGMPLKNVESYKCYTCSQFTFTESQARKMEARTEKIKQNTFSFDKKISVLGKSLAVGIPSELVKHVSLKKGSKVKIIPLTKTSFKVIKIL